MLCVYAYSIVKSVELCSTVAEVGECGRLKISVFGRGIYGTACGDRLPELRSGCLHASFEIWPTESYARPHLAMLHGFEQRSDLPLDRLAIRTVLEFVHPAVWDVMTYRPACAADAPSMIIRNFWYL